MSNCLQSGGLDCEEPSKLQCSACLLASPTDTATHGEFDTVDSSYKEKENCLRATQGVMSLNRHKPPNNDDYEVVGVENRLGPTTQ